MGSKLWIGLVALSVLLAAPALAGKEQEDAKKKAAMHTKKVCTEDLQTCVDNMVAKLEKKGWVGIEMDTDEATGGWVLTKVEPDSPALAAGLRKGDVLVAVNGVPYGTEDKQAWKKVKSSMTIGNTITYTVLRDGQKMKAEVTLERIPDDVMAKWIGRHVLEHSTVELAQK